MRLAIVGAGAAGLVMAREARRAGLEPVVFEAQEDVGGTWIHRRATESDPLGLDPDERLHGSMYDGLRTNLPVDLMAFRDTPFEATSRFVGHAEVLAYLAQCADTWGVRDAIRFGATMTGVELAGDGFRVRWDDGAPHMAEVEAVAIANGHYHVPHVPALGGEATFTAPRSHSHNYRRPEPWRGQRVAVLGAMSSGTDIALELAEVASAVHVCAREHGALVPSPHPRLHPEPAIAQLGPGRRLTLTDGRHLEVDHLLYCTGYRYHLPFVPATLLEVERRLVGPLYRDLIAVRAPTLAVLGLPFAVVPFPLFEAQAAYFAATLTQRVPLPSRAAMAAAVERQREALVHAEVPRRHWLRYGERQFAYVDQLRREVGLPPLPPGYEALYRATSAAKRADPRGYRDDARWRPPPLPTDAVSGAGPGR